MRPNTWFIISSIPGRTRRSTVANYMTYVYKSSLSRFYQERRDDIENEIDARTKVLDTIIEEGTPEGITDHINATKMPTYSIMSSEFGSVLSNMQNKDHEKGVSTLLSKLYYGEGGSMMLSQRGKDARGKRYIPDGLYVTMFAGMQEPHYYLSPIMIRQGLLRRIVLVFCKPSDIKHWIKPIRLERQTIYGELKGLIDPIYERMLKYADLSEEYNDGLIDTIFQDKATDLINEFAQENDQKLKVEESNYNIYQQGFWEHVTKLSMVNAIARDNVKGGLRKSLLVTTEDVIKSRDFLVEATKYSGDIISNLSRIDSPIESAREPIERVFTIISEYGKSGIKQSDIYRKTNMTIRTLQPLLTTLEMQERIEMFSITGTQGRPARFYRVKT